MDITTNALTLTDVSAAPSRSCSCGGCGCGDEASGTAGTNNGAAVAGSAAVREEFLVTDMTCAHCVASVTEELSALGGVASVAVALEAGGTSVVTVESSAALELNAVRAAVEEAGYGLVSATQ